MPSGLSSLYGIRTPPDIMTRLNNRIRLFDSFYRGVLIENLFILFFTSITTNRLTRGSLIFFLKKFSTRLFSYFSNSKKKKNIYTCLNHRCKTTKNSQGA